MRSGSPRGMYEPWRGGPSCIPSPLSSRGRPRPFGVSRNGLIIIPLAFRTRGPCWNPCKDFGIVSFFYIIDPILDNDSMTFGNIHWRLPAIFLPTQVMALHPRTPMAVHRPILLVVIAAISRIAATTTNIRVAERQAPTSNIVEKVLPCGTLRVIPTMRTNRPIIIIRHKATITTLRL